MHYQNRKSGWKCLPSQIVEGMGNKKGAHCKKIMFDQKKHFSVEATITGNNLNASTEIFECKKNLDNFV